MPPVSPGLPSGLDSSVAPPKRRHRLNRPWVHFVCVGLLLFLIQEALFPPPKPVLGPLNEARLETLRTNFEAANGNPPTQEEVQELVAWALDRDMLLQTAIDRDFHLTDSVIRERLIRNMRFLGLDDGRTSDEMFEAALNMSLHLEDTACKRRLVQRMKQTLLAGNPIEDPTEQEIQAEFERRRAELTRPVVGFLHFYFPYDQAEEVDKVKEVIAGKQISPTQAKRLGSVFSMGHHFTRLKPEQLDLFFGRQFADELLGSDPQPGSWYGPLRSTHGLHLIWLDTIDESTVQTADDVRELLERDLKVQLRGEALNAALEQLRQNYEVRS